MQFNKEVEEKKKDLNILMRKEDTETNLLRIKRKEKKRSDKKKMDYLN